LRDGSFVTIRPIAPADRALLQAGFDRLSEESRYRRFLTPTPRLSERMLRYLTEVDHRDHEALVALADDHGVGVARFVRTKDPEVAEAAVTVVDDWQGKGLGTALLELLARRARQEGIHRFSAVVLAQNQDMLDVLRGLGPLRVINRDANTIEAEAMVPDEGIGPHLHEILRGSAAGAIEVRPVRAAREAIRPG
jgi:GNAT superfamily N-acetyltransferase